MNLKQWRVSPLDKAEAARLAQAEDLPMFLALMLEIRGITDPERIAALLGEGQPLSDPYLMKDMDKAVQRIRAALDNFEKIAVYGDYDADGVTATAILYSYLQTMGADVEFYIPKREGEGYGMNKGAVEILHQRGVKLIITVDNGISSVEEIALAKELGIDVVVTDHHRPHKALPDACAVVDAHREDDDSPCKDLCGAGVALKLLMALEEEDPQMVLEEFAQLAALGTIGDVMPLTGENRSIVRRGMAAMESEPAPGIEALLERCSLLGKKLSATGLAFSVIPRLNATGRMGNSDRAVQLLCSEEPEEAAPLADEICEDNERRRAVEAQISAEVFAMIQADPALAYSRVMVISGRNWHHGVVGIVAARVTERFGKPCFVISVDDEMAKGSGRSVEGFSLFDAVSYCEDLLERYGGHPMAAGATLRAENVEEFRRKINEYAARVCPVMPAPVLQLDCRLNPTDLGPAAVKELRRLEPFGSGNPQPLFGLYKMELKEITPVGGGNHLRLTVQREGGRTVSCMRFGVKLREFPYSPGELLDLAVTLDVGEYRGEEQLTIAVRDLRPSGLNDGENLESYRLYERYRREEPFSQEEASSLAPNREELGELYLLLKARRGAVFEPMSLLSKLKTPVSLGKLLFSLDVLEAAGLATREEEDGRLSMPLVAVTHKVDIFAAAPFARLRQLEE